MRFRFTLTHRGSQVRPFAVPALNQWETQTGADEEWSLGPIPNVTLPGVTFGGDDSEYLWVDYSFEDGVEYEITASYTKTYLSGISNPRTIYLRILDNSFATIFSETDSTPPSPGGTGSVTIAFTGTPDCKKIAIKVSDGSEVTFTIDEVSGTSVDPSDTFSSLEINEPDGWQDAVLKLARDKDYRSLIEFFEGSFIFYGNNGVVNGGIEFIKALELEFGPDVSIEMLIELTLDEVNFDEVFNGQLDLSLAEELMDNKFRIPIIRDNFWAKFINRKDTPVDLQASTDLDLISIDDVVDTIDLILPGQIINYFTEYRWPYSKTYNAVLAEDDVYLMLNWDEEIKGDIKLFTIGKDAVDSETFAILGLIEAPWSGVYIVEIRLQTALYNVIDDKWIGATLQKLVMTKTNTIAIEKFDTTFVDIGSDSWNDYIITTEVTLIKGEQLVIAIEEDTDWTVFGETQLYWKPDCDMATTQTITLSGEQTIDGVLTSSSRVLVKNQGNVWENGIYVSAAGAWTRATDLDIGSEANNAAVYVTGGDNQSDSAWRQTETLGVIEVDAIIWLITDPSDERFRAFPAYPDVINYIKINAKTLFRESNSSAFLIHDAADAILKSYGLGESNPFYSELLGSQLTNARQYSSDGCAWKHAVLRGLQLRGYTLAAKPFFLSFNEWWKGVNPIFNLGLTYETIGGYTTDPQETIIDEPPDWVDGEGDFPGAWNYSLFSYPTSSVNGNGGVEGYTCGNIATIVAGETYIFTTVMEIYESGDPLLDITFIWAILDADFNEITTQEYTYETIHGFKIENFTLTPMADGVYFGVRVINNTPFATKTVTVRYAVGDTAIQLLSNAEFEDASIWTNEGAGTSWVIGSDVATVTLAAGTSKALTQEFVDGIIGEYHFISEYRPEDIGGGETVNLTVNFYDSGDNLVSTKTDLLFNNNTKPFDWIFTSLVVVTKIEIIADLTAGADITITLPFAGLFIVVPTDPIVVPEEQVIRVEEVEHFYDPDYVLTISNIRDITRKYDNDKIYNKINIGYNTWKSEDISGIDDPQTQHIYSTRFEKIGGTITLWSEFIAASLAIETTRRKTISESTDYKFDDSTFIIAINPDDVSPDVYRPELDENFSDIENLLDSELRYNLRLTPARNFLRWRKWFNGCLQNFVDSFYKFVRGEGNFDMVSTMIEQSPECLDEGYNNQPLSEKQDIQVTDEFIALPNYYEMEVPLDWEDYKIIRDNRKKAIGISMTDDGHVAFFIDQLDYSIMHAKAKITGWTNEFMELRVIEDAAAEQLCLVTPTCVNPITASADVALTDEFGVCITA